MLEGIQMRWSPPPLPRACNRTGRSGLLLYANRVCVQCVSILCDVYYMCRFRLKGVITARRPLTYFFFTQSNNNFVLFLNFLIF